MMDSYEIIWNLGIYIFEHLYNSLNIIKSVKSD